jgi:hypothetical protein
MGQLRPQLMQFTHFENNLIEGIKMTNSRLGQCAGSMENISAYIQTQIHCNQKHCTALLTNNDVPHKNMKGWK